MGERSVTNKPLTQKQAAALEFIKSFISKNGYPPTIREIADYMGHQSSSTAFNMLEQLVRKGYVKKEEGAIRTLQIVDPKKMDATRRIYLASSWKNAEHVMYIKGLLVSAGFEVDAFCDTDAGRFVFSFDMLPDVDNLDARTVLEEPAVKRAFAEDKKWLDWADTVLLILPAGKSAHLEAGYAAGAGKKLVIYQDEFPRGEFDVMYGFADLISNDFQEIIQFLKGEAL
ncbi:hypothetical protein J2TS6_43770 [Paenibacillus albilobatus]|uniref:LexA repressor DNA-binding domain-containing protein n=1 Tax=Paenibacillus albilobatus TaxID=2716884 RepID=A0A920CB75_9BACL|nr:hypothetical protein J2TS6_43770 [Paenibacillus albilobatus]